MVLYGNFELMEDYDSNDPTNSNHNNGRRGRGVSADPLLVYVMQADGNEQILYKSRQGQARGSFRVPLAGASAQYWMCVQNSSHGPDASPNEEEQEHPDHITRRVGLTYRVEPNKRARRNHQYSPDTGPIKPADEQTEEWVQTANNVEEKLRSLLAHQNYMRMRESDHRTTVERTFGAVLSWTLAEAAMVCAIAVGQIMYFRRFLERPKPM
jgi:hypothetical protein